MTILGNRVADLRVRDILDVRNQESDFSCLELLDLDRLRREHAELLHVEYFSVRPEADFHSFTQCAGDNSREDDDATIGVKPRIKDQALKWCVSRAFRWRQPLHNRF